MHHASSNMKQYTEQTHSLRNQVSRSEYIAAEEKRETNDRMPILSRNRRPQMPVPNARHVQITSPAVPVYISSHTDQRLKNPKI